MICLKHGFQKFTFLRVLLKLETSNITHICQANGTGTVLKLRCSVKEMFVGTDAGDVFHKNACNTMCYVIEGRVASADAYENLVLNVLTWREESGPKPVNAIPFEINES